MTHHTHPDPAVRDLIAQAEARGAERAMRDAADDVADVMSEAWGGDQMWLTTGSKVADLVADYLRNEADTLAEHRDEVTP